MVPYRRNPFFSGRSPLQKWSRFPDVEVTTWPRCQQLLPHVLVCADFIDQWHLSFPEAADLLHGAGIYLQDMAQYSEAEQLYQRALHISEQVLGPEHPKTAITRSSYAQLLRTMKRDEEAAALEASRGDQSR
jgi:tetratricopeptide (TPR) repeat protein